MYRSRLAVQLATLGDRLIAMGQIPESLVPHARALQIRQQLADERPEDPALARFLGLSLFKMGYAHRVSGAIGEARAYHRRAWSCARNSLRPQRHSSRIGSLWPPP